MSLTRRDVLLSTSATALTGVVARSALAQNAPLTAEMLRADEVRSVRSSPSRRLPERQEHRHESR